jgi:hypothetical protein
MGETPVALDAPTGAAQVTTICAQCQHVSTSARNEPHWKWLCLAVPLPQWTNWVTGVTAADPPFQFCKKINTQGTCPLYEEGVNSLHPRQIEEATDAA